MRKLIKILNYGMGNCGSIKNMLRYLGAESEIINEPKSLADAGAIILPGVGSFDHGMVRLEPFRKLLEQRVVQDKVPFMGICLGMQLLLNRSDEGELSGLGWIEGTVKRFNSPDPNLGERLIIPHMGWNEVRPASQNSLLSSSGVRDRFYFVHSFHAIDVPVEEVLAYCHYGYDFVCAVQKNNIFGVQFHPEKSHKFGKQVFRNFIELSKC